MTHRQFYRWCKDHEACEEGLRWLALRKYTLEQFWDRCEHPRHLIFVLAGGLLGQQKNAAKFCTILLECGLFKGHSPRVCCSFIRKNYRRPVLVLPKPRKPK